MAQIKKNINEKEVTTDATEIQRLIRANHEQLFASESGQHRRHKFLEGYNLPRLNQKETENRNILLTVVKLNFHFPQQSLGSKCFTSEFYQKT